MPHESLHTSLPGCSADLFQRLEKLADRGLTFDAIAHLDTLRADPAPRAQLLLGRLLSHLGNGRAARAIALRLWRRHPDLPVVRLHYVRALCGGGDFQRARQLFDDYVWPEGEGPTLQSDWHGLGCSLHARLRDFGNAALHFERARGLAAHNPWIWIEYSNALEYEDRYQDAIEAARKALDLEPLYRPGVQQLAHLLTLVRRDEEAIALLTDFTNRTESGDSLWQLCVLQSERGDHAQAYASLERVRPRLPYLDRTYARALRTLTIDLLLLLGRHTEAVPLCREAKDPWHGAIADRLEQATEEHRRVLLPVPFVRQHHLTCAPATLSALSGYWQRPAEHLQIAEKICYDGTSLASERAWAEQNGFLTREFTVDWPTACRLLDAGLPFTLSTSGTTMGHLQAVIGYDTLRRSLLIREPSSRIHFEFNADPLFASQRANGPRGLLLLPPEEARRIDGIELPDAAHWDSYYQVMRALDRHDRTAAAALADAQTARAPDHWLSVWCQRAIAGYDSNLTALLGLTERLLERTPDDTNATLAKADLLSATATAAEGRAWLESAVERNPWDAPLLVALANRLAGDPELLPANQRLVRRALRVGPLEASAWKAYGDLLWGADDKTGALVYYRIASCLADLSEDHASSYFAACHGVGQTTAGLSWLRQRALRLGPRSAAPVITYFQRLEMLEETGKAFDLLETALRQRPDDTDLALFAVAKYVGYSRLDAARERLQLIAGPVRQAGWLRAKALLARKEGQLDEAQAAALEACDLEPLDTGLLQLAANITSLRDGPAAALALVKERCARQPHNLALQEVLIGWLADSPPAEVEPVIRRLLEIQPHYPSMQRELAFNLGRQRRMPEAWMAAARAVELAAGQPQTFGLRGFLHWQAGEFAQAQAEFRQAIEVSVEYDYAVNALFELAGTHEARQEALAYVAGQIRRQSIYGDALLQFESLAANVLPPAEIRALLQEMLDRRPDLWQAWVALALRHIQDEALDDAHELLVAAGRRFPAVPRIHQERGRIYFLQRRYADARQAALRALRITPDWWGALNLLVEVTLEEGNGHEAALAALNAPLAHVSDSAPALLLRARLLWALGCRNEALQDTEAAIRLLPGHGPAWSAHRYYSRELEPHGGGTRELARRLAQERPDDMDAQLNWAEHAPTADEALATLDQVLAVSPRRVDAYQLRLHLLLQAGRHDEAIAGVDASPWGALTPASIKAFKPRSLWQRGDRPAAIAAMRDLVAAEPNDYLLWRELADWYDCTEDYPAYQAAAAEMIRIAPFQAIAYGFAGDAARKLGQLDAARENFRRAYLLDPGYGFAGTWWADLLLASDDWAQARPVLAEMRRQRLGVAVYEREIRLALRANDQAGLAEPLRDLLTFGNGDASAIRRVYGLMKEHGRAQEVLAAITERCKTGDASVPAVELWLNQLFNPLPRDFETTVNPYLTVDHHDSFKIALIGFLPQVQQFAMVARLVDTHEKALRADPVGWANVGYARICAGDYLGVKRWQYDWQRPDAPESALSNLVVSLAYLRHHQEIRPVAERWLAIDPGNAEACLWLAVDAARNRQPQHLAEWLEHCNGGEVREYFRPLRQALVAYQRTLKTRSSWPLREVCQALAQRRDSHILLDDLLTALRQEWIAQADNVFTRIGRMLAVQ